MRIIFLLFNIALGVYYSVAQVTDTCELSSSITTQAQYIACLDGANARCTLKSGGICDTIYTIIPDNEVVSLGEAWQSASYPTIVFELQGLGSQLNFPASNLFLRIPESSVVVVNSSNTDAFTASNGGNVRIYFGAGNPAKAPAAYTGNDFVNIIAAGGVTVNGFGNPLPVSLLYFTGEEKEGGVYLSWSTASEVNNERFIIEKSFDGQHFFYLAMQSGAGISNLFLKYSHVDLMSNYFNPVVYYRLSQIDFDGESEVFDIIAVDLSGDKEQVDIYPNPTKKSITLATKGLMIEDYSFVISNLNGNEVLSGKVLEGEKIDLTELRRGTYTIVVSSGVNILTRNLVVE